jgi:hypothetical protein
VVKTVNLKKGEKMAKRKKYTLVISKAQRSEPTILQAIAGDDDIADSSISIVENYFARERYENLVEQGYDVTKHGFAQVKERVYGGIKETVLRQPDWALEDVEAKRVNRDPFDTPHLEDEQQEDGMDAVMDKTDLAFFSNKTIELSKAKIRREFKQYINKKNELVSETVVLEITNNDLEQRMFFKIGSKSPISEFRPNTVKMGEQPVLTVETGKISISRDSERKQITVTVNGKREVKWTFTVNGMIWVAEVVAKPEPKAEELDMAI